jgi:glycosyltransferase involved in cell wall biosynthesis
MRVLQLHNRYRHQGGEERAVADITALLRSRGDTVERLERSSAAAGRGAAAQGLLQGGIDPGEVEAAVRRTRAEVVHAHNLHPLFGWRSLAAAQQAGARTVLHVHNFRLFCAIAIGYRDGAPCFRCRGANTVPGLRLRCRGSLPEAAVYAAGLHRQQPRLFQHVDRFVIVSTATARRVVDLGLPPRTAVTLPNFVAAPGHADRSLAAQGEFALVAGRLVAEKGFDTAIAAAREAQVPLVIAGDGPDAARLRALAGADVRFTGRLTPDALAGLRARAAVVLAPSRWEEPCPYAVLDALAAGVPALVSDRGGLPELVGVGQAIAADDVVAWSGALARLWRDPGLRERAGEAARRRARERHGEAAYYERLTAIYRSIAV